MIDYVMTVAVSTSSAVEQITSAFPALYDERVLIGVAAIALITIGNLRGLREAGNIFAVPTYLFLGSALLMIAVGVVPDRRARRGRDVRPGRSSPRPGRPSSPLTVAPAPAGVRGRRRGPDRHRGDRHGRARPSSRPRRRTRRRPSRSWPACSASCSSGSRSSPSTSGSPRSSSRRSRRSSRQVAQRGVRRRLDPVLPVPGVHGAPAVPRREHELQRVPAAPGDPRRGRPHAAPVRVPRRPPRVLVRDHRPRRRSPPA